MLRKLIELVFATILFVVSAACATTKAAQAGPDKKFYCAATDAAGPREATRESRLTIILNLSHDGGYKSHNVAMYKGLAAAQYCAFRKEGYQPHLIVLPHWKDDPVRSELELPLDLPHMRCQLEVNAWLLDFVFQPLPYDFADVMSALSGKLLYGEVVYIDSDYQFRPGFKYETAFMGPHFHYVLLGDGLGKGLCTKLAEQGLVNCRDTTKPLPHEGY